MLPPAARQSRAPRRSPPSYYDGLMAAQVDRDRLQRMLAEGAQLLEVLPAKEYEEEHLPGARSIPLGKLDRATVATLDSAHPIIVYCWDVA